MYIAFTLLFLVAVVFLMIGLTRPSLLKDRKGRSLNRKQAGIGFGLLALLFFVLIGATAPKIISSPAKKVAAASPTPPLPKLTGIGALWNDWLAAKGQPDSRYHTGCCFDPGIQYGVNSESQDDKYYAAFWSNGQSADSRITGYEERFPAQQNLPTSKAQVLQDFPADTSVVWAQANTSDATNECYQMEVESPTLARVFGHQGSMLIEFSTEPTPDPATYNSYYNPNNVNDALIIQGSKYESANDAGGC
jgi:hypothetical protein